MMDFKCRDFFVHLRVTGMRCVLEPVHDGIPQRPRIPGVTASSDTGTREILYSRIILECPFQIPPRVQRSGIKEFPYPYKAPAAAEDEIAPYRARRRIRDHAHPTPAGKISPRDEVSSCPF